MIRSGEYYLLIIRCNRALLLAGYLIFALADSGCKGKRSDKNSSADHKQPVGPAVVDTLALKKDSEPLTSFHSAIIFNRPQVPILCYHQIREWRPGDSKRAHDYIVPPAVFREELKMLADSGYHTILPDQLYNYLTRGTALPPKPVILSFDDSHQEQYDAAMPEMKKYGFKGVFFIMTVSLGRPNYMNKEQIKAMADQGHVIGSHTWDHHNVKKYTGADWITQIEKPSRYLESITGSPIKYFAFPFGLWNKEAIPELKKRGFKAAFQLSAKRDPDEPLYTIRRMIVPGSWEPKLFYARMRRNF